MTSRVKIAQEEVADRLRMLRRVLPEDGAYGYACMLEGLSLAEEQFIPQLAAYERAIQRLRDEITSYRQALEEANGNSR